MTVSRKISPLLVVKNLKTHFPITRGLIFERKIGEIKAVDDVSFEIFKGETLGLVGESGSGKSTLARSIVKLIKTTAGEIIFDGQQMNRISGAKLRTLRKKIQIVFQDPYSSLNPRMTAGEIISEPLLIHKYSKNKHEREAKVKELLELVGISNSIKDRFPHEFSGGQRQRLGIARALALSPDFIVCDEPVSSLDVSVQAQIINLLMGIQKQFNISFLFISHDLSVVKHISHRIAVMYLGKIVEIIESDKLYTHAKHPYTKLLLSAIPVPEPRKSRKKIIFEGETPSFLKLPSGCSFNPRCSLMSDQCKQITPQLKEISSKHFVSCFNVK